MEKKFLIIAGEESGDKNAGKLIKKIKEIDKDVKIFAFAGNHSKNAGAFLVKNITEHGEVGFVEIFDKFSYYNELRKKILRFCEENRIKNIILVDFPGFNLHMAKILKEKGKKIFYYIVPQIWAWGEWRWKHLYKYIDLALCIFPFEENYLREKRINAFYVGHPFLEEIKEFNYSPENVFSFLPGSRKSEIKKLIPVYRKISEKLNIEYPDHVMKLSLIRDYPLKEKIFEIHKGDVKEILKISKGAFIASGTATLEAALLGIPFVIIYKTSIPTYFLAKIFVKVKYAGIVNILLGKEEVREYIQKIDTREIVREFKKTIEEREKFKKISERLKEIFISTKKYNPEDLILENAFP